MVDPDLHSRLAEIWGSLLRLSKVDYQSSFISLGGTSLLAAQVVFQARRSGISVSIHDLIKGATINQLVAKSKTAQVQSVEQTRNDNSLVLLSVGQEAMLKRQRRSFIIFTVAISGTLNLVHLKQALARLPYHHDALRMHFIPSAQGWSVKLRSLEASVPPLDIIDCPNHHSPDEKQRQIYEWASWFREQGTDLVRVALLNDEKRPMLIVGADHLVFDGQSIEIFLREMGSLYSSEVEIQGEPKLNYVEYARQQRSRTKLFPDSVAYWRHIFQQVGPFPRVALPSLQERMQPVLPLAESVEQHIPEELLHRFQVVCRNKGITPFVGYIGLLAVAIHVRNGQPQHLGINTATAGRNWPGTEHIIGSFADEITLDLGITSPLFEETVANAQFAVLSSMKHDHIARLELLEMLCPDIDARIRTKPYIWFTPPLDLQAIRVELGQDAVLTTPQFLAENKVRYRPFPGLSFEVKEGEEAKLVCEYGSGEYSDREAQKLLTLWLQAMKEVVGITD